MAEFKTETNPGEEDPYSTMISRFGTGFATYKNVFGRTVKRNYSRYQPRSTRGSRWDDSSQIELVMDNWTILQQISSQHFWLMLTRCYKLYSLLLCVWQVWTVKL